jgi:hypothetical protein
MVAGKATALAVLALLAACNSGSTPSGTDPECPTPTPARSTAALPDALDLEPLGTVTRVASDRGLVTVRSVTEGTLEELDRSFSVALEDAGYTIVGSENEIIEADIYFADPQGRIGGVKFLTTDCADQVVVRLFIDAQS